MARLSASRSMATARECMIAENISALPVVGCIMHILQLCAVSPTIEKWCCGRRIVVRSEVEVVEGHIPVCGRRIKGFRAFQLQRDSLREMASINAEAFLIERGRGAMAWQECAVVCRACRRSKSAVGEAYIKLLNSPSDSMCYSYS